MSIKSNGLKPIVGTLPPLTFSPSYALNREYTKKYSRLIEEMAKPGQLNFRTCDLEDLGSFLLDGVHFDNSGYKKMAEKFASSILEMA
jgi:lysophospholipase L1-like esterase